MKKTITIIAIVTIIAVGIGGVAVMAGNMYQKTGQAGNFGRFGFMGRNMPTSETLLANLKEELNLTEEQEAKILPILETLREKQRALFEKIKEQGRPDMSAMQSAHQEMRQEIEKQLADILTEEQMQTWQKHYDEQMDKFQGKRHGFFGKGSGGKGFFGKGSGGEEFVGRGGFRSIAEELKLSDAQKQELFEIFIKYRETAGQHAQGTRTEMVNMLLTEDFDEAKVRELYQKMTAEHENMFIEHAKMLAEMKAVLTPEQVELLQEKVPELLDKFQDRFHTKHSMGAPWLQKFGE